MAQIEFSDEQAMLLETAADFCRSRSAMDRVRAEISTENGFDQALWREMADLGWFAIAVPEQCGGLGLGLAGVVPVAESMGRHLLGSPFFATTLAIHAIATSGSDSQKQAWLPRLAEGEPGSVALTEEDGNWRLDEITARGRADGAGIALSGEKRYVLDAQSADVIVVSVLLDGAPRLVLVEREQLPGTALRRETVIDETRRSFALTLDGITVPEANLLPLAGLKDIELAALLLISAEISGGLTGVLHRIVDYLTTRKQFGRLIGGFQALKHPSVRILLDGEAARSHLYHAATLFARGDKKGFEGAVRVAKAHGSAAFAYAGDRAVQFHGAFGFTYECDAQLFLRRALWCQYQFGDERHQRRLLAPLLLDCPAGQEAADTAARLT